MNRRDFFKGLMALGAGWRILPMAEFTPALTGQFKAPVTPVACYSWELMPIEVCTIQDEQGITYGTLVTSEQEIRATVASTLSIVPGEVLDLVDVNETQLPRVLVIATHPNSEPFWTDIVGLYYAPTENRV